MSDLDTHHHQQELPPMSRTPRPYHRDGDQLYHDEADLVQSSGQEQEHGTGHGARNGQRQREEHPGTGTTTNGSESGTEADDERPHHFVKALPPPTLKPRKGLKTGERDQDALLTPSQLDDAEAAGAGGRSTSYFPNGMNTAVDSDVVMRRRLAEFLRRTSEVALMGVLALCVLCGQGVWGVVVQWKRELLSHLGIILGLIVMYPVKLSIVDTRRAKKEFWQRFRVPASFDPATVLYPPLLPVLVALAVGGQGVVLPNIILGLASLPQRLFPRSSRGGGVNAVHWLVTIVPLVLSEYPGYTIGRKVGVAYSVKSGPPGGLSAETLVSLYALHHALLPPLHYLTTTSLLISELHLLSVALINLLLLTSSPQMVILKACLWLGGATLYVLCGHILHWNVVLARVPKWKLRRPGHSAEERKSLVDAVSELINLQRATGAFRPSADGADSDADEDEPQISIKEKITGLTRVATTGFNFPASGNAADQEPKSAVESRKLPSKGHIESADRPLGRNRRNTLSMGEAASHPQRHRSMDGKPRSKLLWCLQLTPEQAARRKWLYAASFYTAVVVIVLGLVRWYIEQKALRGQDPFGWAISYLLGQIPIIRDAIGMLSLEAWVPLPPPMGDWRDISLGLPLDVNSIRTSLGFANVRLLLIAYWAAVLLAGLLAVFTLTEFVEVDTRRKVFHGVMVAMLLPTIFIDPCYCALALGLVLVIFLLLEAIRAGQVPPIGNAISRFVAPYVDGRDLRGPVVVSHIFLLIGCAVPFWFSLASTKREGEAPWVDWELVGKEREVTMVAGVVCVGMGDAAASLIGRRYGRRKWIWVGGKSIEGSAAFAVAVTIGLMFAKAWQVFGGWEDTARSLDSRAGALGAGRFVLAWTVTLAKALFCACGASFMEAVLTGANDNVVVPVALWLLVKGTRL